MDPDSGCQKAHLQTTDPAKRRGKWVTHLSYIRKLLNATYQRKKWLCLFSIFLLKISIHRKKENTKSKLCCVDCNFLDPYIYFSFFVQRMSSAYISLRNKSSAYTASHTVRSSAQCPNSWLYFISMALWCGYCNANIQYSICKHMLNFTKAICELCLHTDRKLHLFSQMICES